MSIRVARASDAAAIAAIYAPSITEAFVSFEEAPPAPDEMAARLAAVLPTHPWLVHEEAGEVLGYAYASRHRDRAAYRWSVDVAVYLDQRAQGRGLGRALYRRLFEILERQGFHAAFAGITLPNPASVALHQRCGFEPVGVYREVGFKQGAWRDVGWWRRPLAASGPGQPAEPIPFARLAEASARNPRPSTGSG
jgi:L-amino acid N-acyltransferase YncA